VFLQVYKLFLTNFLVALGKLNKIALPRFFPCCEMGHERSFVPAQRKRSAGFPGSTD
jgi:hypothetical protein